MDSGLVACLDLPIAQRRLGAREHVLDALRRHGERNVAREVAGYRRGTRALVGDRNVGGDADAGLPQAILDAGRKVAPLEKHMLPDTASAAVAIHLGLS